MVTAKKLNDLIAALSMIFFLAEPRFESLDHVLFWAKLLLSFISLIDMLCCIYYIILIKKNKKLKDLWQDFQNDEAVGGWTQQWEDRDMFET